MSDTPRTDEVWEMYRAGRDDDPVADFSMLARTLERELTAAEKLMDEKHAKAVAIADKLTEARAEIERLRGEIGKAHLEGWVDEAAYKTHRDAWNNSRAKRIAEGKE